MTNLEKKKKEAVKCLQMMDYFDLSVDEFVKNNFVMINEPPMGAHYFAHDDVRLQTEIERFERENKALVYAVVRSFTSVGNMDSLLFVSNYPEDWKYEREEIENGIALAYVINWTYPEFSEIGSIAFRKTLAGGLLRRF